MDYFCRHADGPHMFLDQDNHSTTHKKLCSLTLIEKSGDSLEKSEGGVHGNTAMNLLQAVTLLHTENLIKGAGLGW